MTPESETSETTREAKNADNHDSDRENEHGGNHGKPRRVFRVSSKYALPSDRIPWKYHFQLLVNAATRSGFGKEAIDSDVMEEGLRTQAATLNVGFFTEIGLLEKTSRQYLPTAECLQFVKLKNLDERRAKDALRAVIEDTWFAETARNYLSLHGAASSDTVIKELAIASEVSDFQSKQDSFDILLQYLTYTEVLQQDGDQLMLPDNGARDANQESEREPPEDPSDLTSAEVDGGATVARQNAKGAGDTRQGSTPDDARGVSDWIYRSWPGNYEIHCAPTRKALALMERAVREIRETLEQAEELHDDDQADT